MASAPKYKNTKTKPGVPKPVLSKAKAPARANRSMNALDAAITKGKTLPSKNKMYPGDSDVGMKGFSKKPVIKVKKK